MSLSGVLVGLAISSVALGTPHLAIKRNAGSQVVTPCTSPFAPWNYVGCYNDQIHDPSTLPFDTFGPFDNMTVELCISSCKGNGYRYAGLEYYGSCYCGGAIQGPPADPSQCYAPCTGNASETCGGANTLSIWEDPTFPPVNPSTILDYVSLGCYTEASNNNRALIFQQNITSSTMTTEICLSSCKAMGMPYAGTEYSGECYCGTFLNPGSVPTTSDQCNMPCNGNPSETCGGSRILNLYYASDLVSSQPCGYVPSTGQTSEFTPTPIFGCLQPWQATNIVNAFLYLLANPTASNFNATANALLASDFTDTSDSINQLAGLPEGSVTFASNAAFIAGSGSQPPLYLSTLDIFNSCNQINWRWISVNGTGNDDENVKGIDVFVINEAGQIESSYAEFNSGAWLADLGYPECKSA